jgi:hypothetical protein
MELRLGLGNIFRKAVGNIQTALDRVRNFDPHVVNYYEDPKYIQAHKLIEKIAEFRSGISNHEDPAFLNEHKNILASVQQDAQGHPRRYLISVNFLYHEDIELLTGMGSQYDPATMSDDSTWHPDFVI